MAIVVGALIGISTQTAANGTASSPARVASAEAMSIPPGMSVQIDGVLEDAAWAKAPVINGFVVRDPNEGAAPTHPTDARVLFDATSLYVAIRAVDPEPEQVVGLLTRRDDSSPSDWVAVLVDSFRDRRTAFEFGVNASGVKYDRYWFNDTNNDRGWDAVWDVAVKRDEHGWRAEFKIPFSQLRFKAGASEGFGFAIVRTVAHTNETSTWPLLARSASGYVSSFGDLRGVTVPDTQKKLELMPYAVAQMTTAPVPAGSPLTTSSATASA